MAQDELPLVGLAFVGNAALVEPGQRNWSDEVGGARTHAQTHGRRRGSGYDRRGRDLLASVGSIGRIRRRIVGRGDVLVGRIAQESATESGHAHHDV